MTSTPHTGHVLGDARKWDTPRNLTEAEALKEAGRDEIRQAVAELHTKRWPESPQITGAYCTECLLTWPCPTTVQTGVAG